MIFFLLFCLIILLNFYPVFGSFFLADDAAWLVQAEKAQRNITEIFQPIRWGYFRPFTVFVVGILYNIFSLSTIYYNIFSLLIHIINTFLFFLLTLNITKNKKLSFLSSLFFSISSSHHQAVLWMADLGDLLSGLFFISALYFYLHSNRKIFYLISLLSYTLGLFSKEITIAFILIIILYDFLFHRKFNYKLYIPFWIITLFYIFIYASVVGFSLNFLPYYKIGPHFINNLVILFFELFKNIFVNISHPAFSYFIKEYPMIDLLLALFNILSLISAMIIITLFFGMGIKNIKMDLFYNYFKIILFSIFWIIIILFPLSFFTYLKEIPGAFFARYRFFYLPSLGYSILFASFIVLIYDILKSKKFTLKFLFFLWIFSIIFSETISNNLLAREFRYRTKIQETIVREVGKKCINCNNIYLLNFPEGMHIKPYLQDFIDLYYNKCCKIFFVNDARNIKKDKRNIFLYLEKDGRIIEK